jgi:hypothetical protein
VHLHHIIGILSFTYGATSALAQNNLTPPSAISSSDTPLAPFVTPDSVRNVTGYLLRGSESTPGTCFAAVQLARTELDRHPYKDTLPPAQRSDSLPTTVQHMGAACRSSFTVQGVPTRELRNLLALAIQLGDSAQAHAAWTRWVASPQTQPTDRDESPAETRGKRLDIALHLYFAHRTTGLSFSTTMASVQPLLDTLEGLGLGARRWQLDADAVTVLAQLDNTARAEHWMPAQTLPPVMALWPRMDAAVPKERPSGCILYQLLNNAIQARGYTNPHGVAAFYDSLHNASATVVQAEPEKCFPIIIGPTLRQELSWFRKAGTAATPLRGTYWYHASELPDRGTTWPVTGRLSLLVTVTQGLTERDLGMLRRLVAKYGTQGLSITLAVKTRGYWIKSGPETGPVTPAQEAVDDSAYYLGYLRLPVTLAIVPASFTHDSEQRLRQQVPVQFETVYGKGNMLVLTDRTGQLIVADRLLDMDETRLTAYIARALGK